jgi:iron complex transport system ATP-binding protein
MHVDFPDLTTRLAADVLLLHSQQPLHVLASTVIGGGFSQARWIINYHVSKDYHQADPRLDLRAVAGRFGIEEPFVGLMTAVYLEQAQTVTLHHEGLQVAALVTAGFSNATAAGLTPPASVGPGTINTILLIDANLTPAAMVNAVITATEAKSHTLLAHGLRTSEGHPVTGTSTDAVVVACTGRGPTLPYAGPATAVGWLIGRCLRRALSASLPPPGAPS